MATISRYMGYVNGMKAEQGGIVLPAIETRSVLERLNEMKKKSKEAENKKNDSGEGN